LNGWTISVIDRFHVFDYWRPLQFEAMGASGRTTALAIIAADVSAVRPDWWMLQSKTLKAMVSR